MVVRGNTATNHFARLQTPHLSTNDARTGCMRFRYFISGRTPASLSVIKQGFVTQYIFANGHKTEDHWESAELDVEFLGDKVMVSSSSHASFHSCVQLSQLSDIML
ncbi:hypothetical protein AVEN_85295-1 [Araneus ventricosus]|uniref:MAM domain-containing protein n=1 Tax=Araneus ventricosus TaxID=182803 RepID=A0A4Y2KBM3_ARAVE|nr:hypothetical protein AVEN_6725-1 [Araneus ventricosus]GBM99614.1 hypothetical protein AVEN_85295-1 [Araneus ventricosus]